MSFLCRKWMATFHEPYCGLNLIIGLYLMWALDTRQTLKVGKDNVCSCQIYSIIGDYVSPTPGWLSICDYFQCVATRVVSGLWNIWNLRFPVVKWPCDCGVAPKLTTLKSNMEIWNHITVSMTYPCAKQGTVNTWNISFPQRQMRGEPSFATSKQQKPKPTKNKQKTKEMSSTCLSPVFYSGSG